MKRAREVAVDDMIDAGKKVKIDVHGSTVTSPLVFSSDDSISKISPLLSSKASKIEHVGVVADDSEASIPPSRRVSFKSEGAVVQESTKPTAQVIECSPKELNKKTVTPKRKAAAFLSIAYSVAVILFATNVATYELWKQTETRQDFHYLDMKLSMEQEFERKWTDERRALQKSFVAKLARLERKGRIVCGDDHEECEMWASVGECESNRVFMEYSCRSSCGSCRKAEDAYLMGLKMDKEAEHEWKSQMEAKHDAEIQELRQEYEHHLSVLSQSGSLDCVDRKSVV